MPFKRMEAARPPRQWALYGYPGSGKSTFVTQLAAPMLVIDADHRFAEVTRLAVGEVFQLSDNPADNVDPERIADLLRANMAGSGIKTIVVDSLTAIITPLVTAAVMANDAGAVKNKIASFKAKALALRLLQDTITGTGCDVCWVYHQRSGLDSQAKAHETASISDVELARLRRSLNVTLRVVEQSGKRGVMVEWARAGRSGLTLWDESGRWAGMPERIEATIYEGLSQGEMQQLCTATPSSFASAADAIAWGFEQGPFNDAQHAKNAYDELKRLKGPQTAAEMWSEWVAEVNVRIQEKGHNG